MTWTFPVTKPVKPVVTSMQLYSLYQRTSRSHYTRVTDTAYTHELAMRVYAHRIMAASHNGVMLSIRPIVITSDKVEGITRFPRPMYHRPRKRAFGESRQ